MRAHIEQYLDNRARDWRAVCTALRRAWCRMRVRHLARHARALAIEAELIRRERESAAAIERRLRDRAQRYQWEADLLRIQDARLARLRRAGL